MLSNLMRLAGGLLVAASLSISTAGYAATVDCTQQVAAVVAAKPDRQTVKTAQQQLDTLGISPGAIDGILGGDTKSALIRFCSGAVYAVPDNLLVALKNHAVIYKSFHDWTTTLASSGFAAWAKQQPDASLIARIVKSGNAEEVILVLERYRKYKSVVPVPKVVDALYSYMLTKDDLDLLKSRSKLLDMISPLQGKGFVGQEAFDAAVTGALKGVQNPNVYLQLVEKHAKQQAQQALTPEAMDELKVANLPVYILSAIQGMAGLNYPDGQLEQALDTAMSDLSDKVMAYKPQIVELADISPEGAKLTEDSVAKFVAAQKGAPLADAIAAPLRKLEGIEYKDDKALAWAVKKVLMAVADKIAGSVTTILDHARDVTAYSLDEQSMAEIGKELEKLTVPEKYLGMLDNMAGVDYPDGYLFWQATVANVSILGQNNNDRRTIYETIDRHAASTLDAAMLDEMKKDGLPPAALAELQPLIGQSFVNPEVLKDAVDQRFKALGEEYAQYKDAMLAQAKKRHPFDQAKAAQWSGAGCNCVRNSLEGTVFGFYPFWKAAGVQKIDFSMLSRVEYYGLDFNDNGDIPNASLWQGGDHEFVEQAKRYNTDVDLVLNRDDWNSWNRLDAKERDIALDRLATNVVRLLDTPLTGVLARLKPYITLGINRRSVMGDGVTLYFDNYPTDDEAVDLFDKFFKTLVDRVNVSGKKRYVNLVLRSDQIGQGIYSYDNLIKLAGLQGDSRTVRGGMMLVLLREPTTSDKKLLRQKIEDNLHGKDRIKLLRNVAMVVEYDGHDERQLTDDVIYAGDNFGGIGFWTQPYVEGKTDPGSGDVSHALKLEYLTPTGGVDTSSVCKYICPNRWLFRIAWDLMVLILIGSFVLYARACAWRGFFDNHFLHFIVLVAVPFLLLTHALLFCDPSWEETAKGNSVLIAVVLGILAYSIWRYRDNKRKAELP